MIRVIAQIMIRRMCVRYDYDASYLFHLLKQAPSLFWKFAPVFSLARYRKKAPAEAIGTVKIFGTMFEDCGPCTQLMVQFAREMKISPDQIEAVLTRKEKAMNSDVRLAFRYARAVLERQHSTNDEREAIRLRWGEAGLIELAMAVQTARLFPMLKEAMGYSRECRRVQVEGRPIDVVKQVA